MFPSHKNACLDQMGFLLSSSYRGGRSIWTSAFYAQVSVSRFRNSQAAQRAKQNPPFWGPRGIGIPVFELEESTYHLKVFGRTQFVPACGSHKILTSYVCLVTQDTRLSSVPMVMGWLPHSPTPRLMWFKAAEINTGPGSWRGGSEQKHQDLSQMGFVAFHTMSWQHRANPIYSNELSQLCSPPMVLSLWQNPSCVRRKCSSNL